MATAAQVEKRVAEVYQWMMIPISRVEILQKGSEKWGVSERQIDSYMSRSKAIIHEVVTREHPHKLSEIIKKLDLIYEKAMFGGTAKRKKGRKSVIYMADMGVARQSLMDQAKLLGLIIDKIQPVDDGRFDGWTTEELENRATAH